MCGLAWGGGPLPALASDNVPPAAAASTGPASTAPAPAHSEAAAGHGDSSSYVFLELGLILFFAAVGRWAAARTKAPPVLGELLIGVAIGNLGYWLGLPVFQLVMNLGDAQPLIQQVWATGEAVTEVASRVFTAEELAPGGVGALIVGLLTGPDAESLVVMSLSIVMFSGLGVNLLLFMVGLETSVAEMVQVGRRALAVALVGVLTPFALGIGTSLWLLPGSGAGVHLFVAATLCATSVGITARVFRDLGRARSEEARVILGAAVIDDVLGLFLLAVVMGIVATGHIDVLSLTWIILSSGLFLGGLFLFGERFVRLVLRIMKRVQYRSQVLFPLSMAFLLSWVAGQLKLAPIVGAFAAGLIINERDFAMMGENRTPIRELLRPLETIFAPIFFILMGMQVNLSAFAELESLQLALIITAVAFVGKIVAGLAAGPGIDRLTVGIGMVPRGEVGLIFASIGKGLGVMSDTVFSAIIIMVIATTVVTPLVLRWTLFRKEAEA